MIEPITIQGMTFDVKEVSSLCFNHANQELSVYLTTGTMYVIYYCPMDEYRYLLTRVDRSRTPVQEYNPYEQLMSEVTTVLQHYEDKETDLLTNIQRLWPRTV